MQLSLINRKIENDLIPQRASDGYINATAMCKAVGKQFNDYSRTGPTQAFLQELAAETGLPVSGLIVTIKGGNPEMQGTWVHPDVAINLGQWCSPKFAVAVSRWVREWISGRVTTTKLPYHLERYMANRASIPINEWSMLNEMTFNLIAPLEQMGYHLPEEMVPDISEGRMFCKWLRDHKKLDTSKLPTYPHVYNDSRIVDAKRYPLAVLEDFRNHFYKVWLPQKAEQYFRERDPKALPYIEKMLLALDGAPLDSISVKEKFQTIKGKVAAAVNS